MQVMQILGALGVLEKYWRTTRYFSELSSYAKEQVQTKLADAQAAEDRKYNSVVFDTSGAAPLPEEEEEVTVTLYSYTGSKAYAHDHDDVACTLDMAVRSREDMWSDRPGAAAPSVSMQVCTTKRPPPSSPLSWLVYISLHDLLILFGSVST